MANDLVKLTEESEKEFLHVKVQVKLQVPRFIKESFVRKYLNNKLLEYISIVDCQA